MNKIPFIDLRKAHQGHVKELEDAALRVIRSGRYLLGEETRKLEQSLSKLYGVDNVVCCGNGLDALRLIIRGWLDLGMLKRGDHVIYPANTYIASVLPLTEFGLVPVGIEPDRETLNLSFSRANKEISERRGSEKEIKAVILVHLYGFACWDEEICRKWAESGVLLLEDNAQAIGARVRGIGLNNTDITGGLAHASASSFYPTKNLGALGDAGAVATRSPELAERVRALANYGSDRRYHNITQGYNSRIDELQAAFLNVGLKGLEEEIKRRREIAAIYTEGIRHPEVTVIKEQAGTKSVWHQFPVICERRDDIQLYLQSEGIATDIHYATPPHLQPCYQGKRGDFPITEEIADRILSLPIQGIGEREAKRVVEAINNF